MRRISSSLEETHQIAMEFLETLKPDKKATIVALKGNLGSGKTAFCQEAGKVLGVSDNMHSPTFVIEKIYTVSWRGFKNLIHLDAYRLEKDSELLHLGWNEIIKEPENLIFIEWPENVSSLIPREARHLSFKFIDEKTREIEIYD